MTSCTADKVQPTESELHSHNEDYAYLRNSHGTIAAKDKLFQYENKMQNLSL
jgi:hypothetical protein